MKKKRRKTSMPIMLMWSKRDQLRFIDAVERLQSLVNDLAVVLEPAKRKKAATKRPAAAEASKNAEAKGADPARQ